MARTDTKSRFGERNRRSAGHEHHQRICSRLGHGSGVGHFDNRRNRRHTLTTSREIRRDELKQNG